MLTTSSPQTDKTSTETSGPSSGSVHDGYAQDNRPAAQRKRALQDGIVQRAGDDSPPSDQPTGYDVSLEQNMILLQGVASVTANIKGFFGFKSTFIQLVEQVDAYQKTSDEKEKETIKKEILRLGKEWLGNKGEREELDENDQKKKESITKIVDAIENPKVPDLELGNMSEKVGYGARIKEFFTGEESTFKQIEGSYSTFQAEATGQVDSFEKLYEILKKGQDVFTLCELWKSKHIVDGKVDNPEKLAMIKSITAHLGLLNIQTTIHGWFNANIKRIDIAKLGDKEFVAEEVTLTVPIGDGIAIGSLQNVKINENNFSFSELKLQYQGELSPIQAVTITDPSLTLKSVSNSYIASAEGGLKVEVSEKYGLQKLDASGKLSGTYDFEQKKFSKLKVEEGSLDLSFHNLHINVTDLNAESGYLTAKEGTLSTSLLGKPITGSMSDIAYTREEGVSFKSASISSDAEYELSSVLKVDKPSLSIHKTDAGWQVTGAGKPTLNGSIPNVQLNNLTGDVSLTYDVSTKELVKGTLENGSGNVKLFDFIDITAQGISYEDGNLGIKSATGTFLKGDVFGKSGLKVEGKGIKLSKEEASWEDISFELGNTLKMGAFKFTLPNGHIMKKDNSISIFLEHARGEITVAEGFKAEGDASFAWTPETKGPFPDITTAKLDITAATDKNFPNSRYIPFWPLSFDFETLITPIPVPISGGVALELGGQAPLSFSASLVYADDQFELKGNAHAEPELYLKLTIRAGIGSSLIVYVGGFLSGKASAKADTDIGLHGIIKKGDGYTLDSLVADYSLNARFLATVTGGVEYRVLKFFGDKYEVKIKEWDLGSASYAGKYDFVGKKRSDQKSTKYFNKDETSDIPKPDAEVKKDGKEVKK